MAIERTLSIIKPDAVAKNVIGQIISRFEGAGLKIVAAKLVTDADEVMLITTGGVLIRTRVKEIRELGRATQGVTLISLDDGEKLAGLEKIVETDDDEEN